MSDLRDLYQQVILDHGRKPRNVGALEDADGKADGYNPLCGDRITVFVKTDGNRVQSVRFEGSGCAISVASASMMTQAVEGLSLEQGQKLFEAFHDLATGKRDIEEVSELLNKLVVFSGVREFPVRVKCATLPWHTLRAALKHQPTTISTE